MILHHDTSGGPHALLHVPSSVCQKQLHQFQVQDFRLSVSGGLQGTERKLAAVATKLVTCPALLLLDRPLDYFSPPRHMPAAQHFLRSLKTAACQLRINMIMTQEVMQDAAFDMVDNLVMLDQQAQPVYAGAPNQVRMLLSALLLYG